MRGLSRGWGNKETVLNNQNSRGQMQLLAKKVIHPPHPPQEYGGPMLVTDSVLRMKATRRPKTAVLAPTFSVRSNAMLNPGDTITIWPHLPKGAAAKLVAPRKQSALAMAIKGKRKPKEVGFDLSLTPPPAAYVYYSLDKSEPQVLTHAYDMKALLSHWPTPHSPQLPVCRDEGVERMTVRRAGGSRAADSDRG